MNVEFGKNMFVHAVVGKLIDGYEVGYFFSEDTSYADEKWTARREYRDVPTMMVGMRGWGVDKITDGGGRHPIIDERVELNITKLFGGNWGAKVDYVSYEAHEQYALYSTTGHSVMAGQCVVELEGDDDENRFAIFRYGNISRDRRGGYIVPMHPGPRNYEGVSEGWFIEAEGFWHPANETAERLTQKN